MKLSVIRRKENISCHRKQLSRKKDRMQGTCSLELVCTIYMYMYVYIYIYRSYS